MEQLKTFLEQQLLDRDWNHFLIGADWADENGYPHAAEWLRWMAEQRIHPRLPTGPKLYFWELTPSEGRSDSSHGIPLPLASDHRFQDHSFSRDYSSPQEAWLDVLQCAEREGMMPPCVK